MSDHPFHDVVELFPRMTDEQFEALVDDIKANGVRVPVLMHEGQIVDGRHRWLACDRLGIKCPTTNLELNDGESMVSYVIALNLKRRHLTTSQRAMVGVDALPLYEAEAAGRKAANGGDRRPEVARLPPPVETAKARDEAAATASVSARYIQDAKKIAAESPETAQKVRSGVLTLQDAKREIKVQRQTAAAASDDWPDDETNLRKRLDAGETIVVNLDRQHHIVGYARSRGLLTVVDRSSPWGNPFMLNDDGDRDACCDKYRDHYLPHKTRLMSEVRSLRGRALGCHCAPERCHADAIAEAAEAGR